MRIVLLAGGDSSERAVSLDSSAAIWQALERLGHEVVCVDPASGLRLTISDGQLLPLDEEKIALEGGQNLVAMPEVVDFALIPEISEAELVFLGLHGGAGENGSIQNLLEMVGVAYTGSGVTASVAAMDKAIAKHLMRSVGVRTAPFVLCRFGQKKDFPAMAKEVLDQMSCPLIVKPNDGGSTVGLSKVTKAEGLVAALELAADETHSVLVEQFIAGRELTVAVLDGEALPVVEIRPKSGLYDYEAKYTKGKTEYIAPAEIEPKVAEAVRAAAEKVYDVIGAAGLARVDFILNEQNEFYCLELNTLPGMTELSLSPMAAKAVGMSFDQLIERIVAAGLRMKRDRWTN